MRGFRLSESVVFHLICGCLPSAFGLCLCFGVCLFLHSEDFWLFAFHLFSYNLKIADRPQDVLMTVRASSAHDMS